MRKNANRRVAFRVGGGDITSLPRNLFVSSSEPIISE